MTPQVHVRVALSPYKYNSPDRPVVKETDVSNGLPPSKLSWISRPLFLHKDTYFENVLFFSIGSNTIDILINEHLIHNTNFACLCMMPNFRSKLLVSF